MNLKMANMKCDVLIIGSGFAGSLCAMILASKGRNVIVVDRGSHPRFSIGESSTPIANMILRDLAQKYGLDFLIPLCSFGKCRESYPGISVGIKRGFSYFSHRQNHVFEPGENHEKELYVAASSSDYSSDTQWFREEIDSFLAVKAAELGATIVEDTSLSSIKKSNTGWEVFLSSENSTRKIEPRFIIDASGSGRVLERMLGIPKSDYTFKTNTKASFSHFRNCKTIHSSFYNDEVKYADLPFNSDNSAVHHILEDSSWNWMLRFSNGITSSGLVVDQNGCRPEHPGPDLLKTIENYPSIRNIFSKSDLAASPSTVIQTDRLQRSSSTAAGKGWAMLPHTFGFVDPLHSTGIAWSMNGVRSLLDLLIGDLSETDFISGLADYSRKLNAELQFIDSLCSICYETMKDFDKFAASTMLYFAASVGFEKTLTNAHNGIRGTSSDRSFLHAETTGLVQIAKAAQEEHLKAGYAQWLEDQIDPYNDVGLFRPETNNIYLHTVAEL